MTNPANAGTPRQTRTIVAFPASFGQKRMWLYDRKNYRRSVLNMYSAVRVLGAFDVEAFRASVREVVRRHESLRTYFLAIDGEPNQIIAAEIEVEVPVVDLRCQSPKVPEDAVLELIQEEISAPFDLHCAPLWRIRLFRLGAQDHALAFVMHHIISDGWSIGIMLQEVSLFYSAFISGRSFSLPELPMQYAEFSEWEREAMRGKIFQTQLAYWKAHLSGTRTLHLPYDRPRRSTPFGPGGSYSFSVDEPLTLDLRNLCRQRKATLHMILLAIFQMLLYRYTGEHDIVVGSNVARRNMPEVRGVIGFFVNTVAIRTRLSGEWSFYQLLDQVREITLAAYENQDIPFSCVLNELASEMYPGRPPICQTSFNGNNFPRSDFQLGAAVLRPLEINFSPARQEISVFATDMDKAISFGVTYDQDLFELKTIANMFQHYLFLLRNIVYHPEQAVSQISSAVTF